jgi:hippurate hydrolase
MTMGPLGPIEQSRDELIAWRRDLHQHPEMAFQEERTSNLVAARLESFGIDITRGIAETGIVGTLKAGTSSRSIGLRADMDALRITEQNGFSHRSSHDGTMHACGHDGHTTMLLGAARYLAKTRAFDGTVHFIFQPAEEGEGGAHRMIEEGLFDRFPCESVFGMHNWPGMPAGHFGLRPGPMMASFNVFEIEVTGRGAHAAMPHLGVDPILAASHLVVALQSITSRNVSPVDSAVVTVTQIHAGEAWNVIPPRCVLRGTTRAFSPETQDLVEQRVREVTAGIAQSFGTTATVRYERRSPATVNAEAETLRCADVLRGLVGSDKVHYGIEPTMGSEDFSYMLQKKPGCYVFIGNGPGEGGCLLHNPRYDFNDDVLTLGASYWARLVESLLPLAA